MPNTYKGGAGPGPNTDGTRPGYAGHGKPSLGFDVRPEHSHLEHFTEERFLREGHNIRWPGWAGPGPIGGGSEDPGGLGRRPAQGDPSDYGDVAEYVKPRRIGAPDVRRPLREAGFTAEDANRHVRLARRGRLEFPEGDRIMWRRPSGEASAMGVQSPAATAALQGVQTRWQARRDARRIKKESK